MPLQTTGKIWHNGNLIPWEKANIHVMSHVVHYGSSVFEGIRCYGQPSGAAVFRLPEHMQRLLDSAKIYRMALPYSLEQLSNAVVELIEANGSGALLHSPHRVSRIRRDRREPEGLAGRGLHRELPVGQVRRREMRRGCVRFLLEPLGAEHHCPRWPRRAGTT